MARKTFTEEQALEGYKKIGKNLGKLIEEFGKLIGGSGNMDISGFRKSLAEDFLAIYNCGANADVEGIKEDIIKSATSPLDDAALYAGKDSQRALNEFQRGVSYALQLSGQYGARVSGVRPDFNAGLAFLQEKIAQNTPQVNPGNDQNA